MLKLLGGLKEFIKRQPVTVDGAVFRVHVSFTTAALLACSLMVTATQYVGNPIQCIVDGLPTRPVNTYCWITSTFTMPDAFRREPGVGAAHPGVGPAHEGAEPAKYYTYYQWVCFALFFQAMMCYFPKWLWDMQEGGLMSTLVMGLNFGLGAEKEKDKQKKILVHYMLTHIRVSGPRGLRERERRALCSGWVGSTASRFVFRRKYISKTRTQYIGLFSRELLTDFWTLICSGAMLLRCC